ncbi:hypothetical protein [Aestuariivirga sp.]|uniref:hypothetical protein n=1 Tax=Aestuariivirga sp. TaxID=2650926 RepID=UPI0025C54BB1|nr:hypothetical protein [Aestuariivirga sp.]MCA3554742.1 hypothetical protein [Aestuariivirga sp.]
MKADESMPGRPVDRRGLMGLSVAAAATALAAVRPAQAGEAEPMLMFVQLSGSVKVDEAAKTVRLVNVTPHTLYFADRPERLAGHIRMAAYLEEWTSKAGKDNFAADPPNAALSVYEEGQTNNTLAIVEISDPKVDGQDLVYSYKLINGKPPTTGGETALFIDWIGVGGGVGVGFHGVGVGVRGPRVF